MSRTAYWEVQTDRLNPQRGFIVTRSLRQHVQLRKCSKYIGLLFSILTIVEVQEDAPNVCVLNKL
jgi:hypothetical protein